ncbi:MAG: serine hydrolase [Lachnospiraceae bacterium]|nr:serine hydrolase [Lachnospiraceae bacterium]
MKCISNKFIYLFSLIIFIVSFTGCGYSNIDIPYSADSNISSFRLVNFEATKETTDSFASKICVVDKDISNEKVNIPTGVAGGLFDSKGRNVLYAKSVHESFAPASLTKIMTAIVALKYGSADMMLTASSNVKIPEYDAQVMDLKPGDQMTLDQALHFLLIYSANDVAIMIAEGVGGSIENFVSMMNQEAIAIGATNTHFANPHGLTQDDHYTTPYDMYLMMNEASQYELFNEIIHSDAYETVYYDAAGNEKSMTVKSTNLYIQGNKQAPSGVTVVGGKTGTTNAAGHCLVLLSRDTKSNPFISIIMRAETKENLYSYMSSLLDLVP